MGSLEKRLLALEASLPVEPVEVTADLFYSGLQHFSLVAEPPMPDEAVDSYIDRLPLEIILTFVRRAVHGNN